MWTRSLQTTPILLFLEPALSCGCMLCPAHLRLTNLLYSRSEDNENYEASRYSAFDISQVLGLSREDFILIAILAGGDYSVCFHGLYIVSH